MDSRDKVQYVQTWWSKDLAKYLDIGESTLRKWSIELEKAGYTFLRDEHNRRTYVERDALALRKMKELLAEGRSYDSASSIVVNQHLRVDSLNDIAVSANEKKTLEEALDVRYDALTEEVALLRADMAQLIELNRSLVARLDDRDVVIRELSEALNTTKAIAAASEERQAMLSDREKKRDEKLTQLLRDIADVKANANKSVWSKLFGK